MNISELSKPDERQSRMEMVLELTRRERSLIRKLKNKEKNTQKNSPNKVKSRSSIDSHNEEQSPNGTIHKPDIFLDSASISKEFSPDKSLHFIKMNLSNSKGCSQENPWNLIRVNSSTLKKFSLENTLDSKKEKQLNSNECQQEISYLNSRNALSAIEYTREKSWPSKKEKFKQLKLFDSKQNERMCININYQPLSGPLGKSKLTIHKDSHIDIRPQLTKHTFTTATCMPQVYSSKPNISTHYLVHLNEGGYKEIEPETEEGKLIFPSE